MIATIFGLVGLIAAPVLYIIGYHLGSTAEEDDEPLDVSESWRKLNLAVGDGYRHPDACRALVGLRTAGYEIEKSGSDRAGFMYLKIISPGRK